MELKQSIPQVAALLKDRTRVTWGEKDHGGDSIAVQGVLSGVKITYSTNHAFAAVKVKKVVTWGPKGFGGDSRSVQAALIGVETIYSTDRALATVLHEGIVVTWGDKNNYGVTLEVSRRR